MAKTVISALYPPLVDPTRTPLAYGDRAVPRLNRELNDNTLLTRQRALMSLCDYLHDPEHIAEVLNSPIPESLKNLLTDSDLTVRQKATECLFVIAGHAIGRDSFLEKEIIIPVSKLFDDKEDIARKNAHKAIEMISETPDGAEGIVKSNLIPKLVGKLSTEHDEIRELILDTLHFCMFFNTAEALSNKDMQVFQEVLAAEGMQVFTELLSHASCVIRAKAARDIMDLSVPLAGKNKAVEVKCMPLLVKLLKDSESEVRAKAALAIMTITITTDGKYDALDCEAIEPLVELVDDPTSEVRANAIKALTCLCEAPKGRKILLNHVDKIRERTFDEIPAVVKVAEKAVKVITWKP
ncbi:radial spoke head 14 homolog [Lineus longissimus]|uniref:radial spoke head 14 homolog n=1 Tax=Lineus longissimus TaxID=88925 RepID=UPI002B4CECCE